MYHLAILTTSKFQCPTTDSGSGVMNWGQFVDTLTSNEVKVRFGILFKLCQEELTYTYTWNLLLYEIPIYLPTCKANLVLSKYSEKNKTSTAWPWITNRSWHPYPFNNQFLKTPGAKSAITNHGYQAMTSTKGKHDGFLQGSGIEACEIYIISYDICVIIQLKHREV